MQLSAQILRVLLDRFLHMYRPTRPPLRSRQDISGPPEFSFSPFPVNTEIATLPSSMLLDWFPVLKFHIYRVI